MDLHFFDAVCVCVLLLLRQFGGLCLVCTLDVQFPLCLLACLSLSLSLCSPIRFSLSSLLAVSASDSQQHPCSPCTISPLSASLTSLRITASHCLSMPLFLLDFHLALFCLHLFPAVCQSLCCCNVSPLSVFQVSPPQYVCHLKPLCVFFLSCFCVCLVSLCSSVSFWLCLFYTAVEADVLEPLTDLSQNIIAQNV